MFINQHLSVDVTGYPFKQPLTGKHDCVLGVRPEDIDVGHGDGVGQAVRASVSLIEAMGAHRVVWLDFHGTQVAGIVQDQLQIETEKDIHFSIRTNRISLFDGASEQRL
jgi:multiple sugar transport system ATP-binding protein